MKRILIGGAIAIAAAAGVLVLRRPSATVSPMPVPRAPAAARVPDPVEAMLRDYARLHELGKTPAELRQAEREIEARLSYVGPNETVDLLLAAPPPAAAALLLRGVDNGLARDREGWEAALAAGLDRARDEGFATVALERLRDGKRRGRAAAALARAARSEGGLILAARHAPADRAAEVREILWARVPEAGAVVGLGYLVAPDEATRLESLGSGLAVVRALETALERTGDAAFRDALRRLGR